MFGSSETTIENLNVVLSLVSSLQRLASLSQQRCVRQKVYLQKNYHGPEHHGMNDGGMNNQRLVRLPSRN
jgi:hypothetical protein